MADYTLYDFTRDQKTYRGNFDWDELELFLQETWDNRLKHTYESYYERGASKQRILHLTRKNKFNTYRYVGTICHGGVKIDIKPRILRNSEEHHSWYNLLFWLSYCTKINFPFNKTPVKLKQYDDLLEIFISIFTHYTLEVLMTQPYSSYEDEECESAQLKGTLLTEKYIRENIVTGRWHKFQIKHKPFTFDNLVNRIIKNVTQKLLSIPNRATVELELILDHLEEVSYIECTSHDCCQVKINPIFEEYETVIEMCKIFLDNLVVDTSKKESHSFAFLLPMDYLFEDFIFGFIDKHIPEFGAIAQREKYLARQIVNGEQESKVFKLQSDIVLSHPQLIIDTKYKMRWVGDNKSGINQNDMYQIMAYAMRWGIEDTLLLYPKNSAKNGNNKPVHYEVELRLPTEGKISVRAGSVDIRVDHSNINSEVERIINEIRDIIQIVSS